MTRTLKADLSPPLGLKGGPCAVVNRIYDSPLAPSQRDLLVWQVEHGKDLANGDAEGVYKRLPEKGVYPFDSILLTSHAQYRMDLRGLTMKDIRELLKKFVAQVYSWQKDPRNPANRARLEELRRPKFEWMDPTSRILLVFAAGPTALHIITLYREGEEVPAAPPGGCPILHRSAAYQPPANEKGNGGKLLTPSSALGLQGPKETRSRLPGDAPHSDRDRAVPRDHSTPENRERHPPGGGAYQKPGWSGGTAPSSAPSGSNGAGQGKPTPVRSPGVPGEQYGHPWKSDPNQRRTADFYLERFPNTGGELGRPSRYNPVNPHPDPEHGNHPPANTLDTGYVQDNPGSTKVVPRGKGFYGREASARRVAVKALEILSGLDSDLEKRGRSLNPRMKNSGDGEFHFTVPGSRGNSYTVTLQADGEGMPLSRVNLKVSCDCEFWRWQGPEHWAQREGYLAGSARGDGSAPDQKDPRGGNRVCKHVAAVLFRLDQWDR